MTDEFNPNQNENLDDKEFGGFSNTLNTSVNLDEESDFKEQEDITQTPKATFLNIAERLNDQELEQNADEDEGIKTPKSNFDFINALNADELAILKSKLNATPDRLIQKKGNPTVTLRKYEDNIIIKFKKSYQKQIMNQILQKAEDVPVIPVLFYGASEYVDIRWDSFQMAERVKFEVVDFKSKIEDVFDGTTISRDTGAEIEMYKKVGKMYFTLKIGTEKVEIESDYVNP